MAVLRGPSHQDIDRQAAGFIEDATAAVHATLKRAADQLHGFVTPDDLANTDQLWGEHLDDLLPHVTAAWDAGVDHTHRALHAAAAKILAGQGRTVPVLLASAADPVFDIPKVQNPLANEQLQNARNRLVAVGNDVWQSARGQLVEGLKAGEGISQLRERVVNSAQFSDYRAQLVARSETSHAMNQGSLAQMRELDTPLLKEWIAIDDARTRPEHAEVDGEKVGINDEFSIGFDPGDDYNCRCTLGYELQDDQAFVEQACPECVAEDEGLSENDLTLAPDGDQALEQVSALRSDITDQAVKEAARDYFSQGYDWTNYDLREAGGDLDKITKTRAAQIRDFDSAFGPTTGDIHTYRGLNGLDSFGKAWQADADMTGTVFTDHAYISTSASTRTAASFAGKGSAPVFLDVYAPKGTRALYNNTGGESEILFEHGQRFRVIKDEGWVQVENSSRELTRVRRLAVEIIP